MDMGLKRVSLHGSHFRDAHHDDDGKNAGENVVRRFLCVCMHILYMFEGYKKGYIRFE